jgi:hypothetical protein
MDIYIPYFYIIRHITSGTMYAGARWKKGCHPKEFMQSDGYQTSSKIIHSVIKKEGLDSFEILRIDTSCDGLHPKEYETLFLEINDCVKSKNWYNGHPNKILSHDSEEFKSIMEKLYGYNHWAKTPEGKEFHRQHAIIFNSTPEQIARWKHHNLHNNPAKKPENRLKHSKSMSETNTRMLANGTHPMLQEKNKILFSEKMKIMRANQPELTCPHCGLVSNAKGNMMRWHFDNCKLI